MTIRKQPDGRYKADFYPSGRGGRRIRKTFDTKAEAERFVKFTLNELEQKPWLPPKDDNRRLSELVDLWYSLHGVTLSDGAKRKNKLLAIASGTNDPIARRFTKKDFTWYRERRLLTVKPKTINNEQDYLNALFNELSRLGEWVYPNPLDGLRYLKAQTPQMGYLTSEDIPLLFQALKDSRNTDVVLVAKICLSTGCRWGEAENLEATQITPGKLTFTNTKGNKNRSVPIDQALFDELPKCKGRLFSSCIGAFRSALSRTGIQLPDGQATHVLRHTFASCFMMNGGNILVLQQILGHASIVDTMKYAHFSPTHLEDAITLNPLNGLDL